MDGCIVARNKKMRKRACRIQMSIPPTSYVQLAAVTEYGGGVCFEYKSKEYIRNIYSHKYEEYIDENTSLLPDPRCGPAWR